MAIYHLSVKTISRNNGKSAVASAAYRSGEKLIDERQNLTFDYHKKEVAYSAIVLPSNAPAEYADRAILWNAVEKIEKQSNAMTAREWEIAIPNELNLEQSKQLIQNFAQSLADEGICADYNIHWKNGNHHAHILGTTRPLKKDGTWGTKERKGYALDKNGNKIPLIDEITGEQKVRIRPGKGVEKLWVRETIEVNDWNTREKLLEWRERWANMVNLALEQAKIDERVDHRSNNERKVDATPTIHEGYAARAMETHGKISERCERNRQIRNNNTQKRGIMLEIEYLRLQEQVDQNLLVANNLLKSGYLAEKRGTSTILEKFRKRLVLAVREVNMHKNLIITHECAERIAVFRHLTEDERKIWQNYRKNTRKLQEFTYLCEKYPRPQEYNDDEFYAFERILGCANARIKYLSDTLSANEPYIDTIRSKIAANIHKEETERVTFDILAQNHDKFQALTKANHNLANATVALQQAVFAEDMSLEHSNFLSARDVYNSLKRQHTALEHEFQQYQEHKKFLESKIIHCTQAFTIAENIFTKGAWKKYREAKHKYEEQVENLSEKRLMAVISGRWSEEQSQIEANEAELSLMKKHLDSERVRLEALCQTKEAQRKILLIATSILSKNAHISVQYFNLSKQYTQYKQQTAAVKERMMNIQGLAIKEQFKPTGTKYRVVLSPTSDKKPSLSVCTAIIADALAGKPDAVRLVATSDGSILDIAKNWDLMTELDKDKEKMRDLGRLI